MRAYRSTGPGLPGTGLLGTGLLGLGLLGACATSPPSPERSPTRTVAVFALDVSGMRLSRPVVARLEQQILELVAESGELTAIPPGDLRRALRRRRATRGDRSCRERPCQAEIGRKLSAGRTLALQLVKNLVGECEAVAAIGDPRGLTPERAGKARGGCADDELAESLGQALCQALSPDPSSSGLADCRARAGFLRAERALRAYSAPRPRALLKDLDRLERTLAEQVLELKRTYERVSSLGREPWACITVCRVGAAYESFGRQLEAAYHAFAPPAAARQAEGQAAFRDEMQRLACEKAAPLYVQAGRLYDDCLTRAAGLKLSSPLLKQAEEQRKLLRLPRPCRERPTS